MGVSGASIKDHIIEHEILGTKLATSTVQVDAGRFWIFDDVRLKWLSTDRLTASAGRDGRARNAYLRLLDGQPSNLTGYRILRTATIVGMTAQTRNVETWTLRIRRNGVLTDIASLALTAVDEAQTITTDVDVEPGDQIQFYADTTGMFGIKDVFVWIEIAWRNDTL